ncbi:MGMT family protein [Candidatus Bathyarchaeota archaeon]|nr:MGMT family protein [Candidatus Bathyarchaeota archaeon]
MIRLYVESAGGLWFGVAADDESIFATTFAEDRKKALIKLIKAIPFNIPFTSTKKPFKIAEKTILTLINIYSGKDTASDLPLNMNYLPGYMKRVLRTVARIPTGYVTSYGIVANAVGGSARAVGRVMANNPFVLIVPCHRVVASDFSLGGYGGGLKAKLEILSRERRGHAADREISVNGNSLRIYPVERVISKYSKE